MRFCFKWKNQLIMDSTARAWVLFLYLICAVGVFFSTVGLCWRQLELRFDADFRVGRRVSHVGDTIDNPITARGDAVWGIGFLKHTANSVIMISCFFGGKLRLWSGGIAACSHLQLFCPSSSPVVWRDNMESNIPNPVLSNDCLYSGHDSAFVIYSGGVVWWPSAWG